TPYRSLGGKGGYAQGYYSMYDGQIIYIAVGGGAGGIWNGGGYSVGGGMNGGGATSIQKSLISDGQLYHYESVKETEVLIVAGGGGGSEWYYSQTDFITPVGGAGGGINGEDGFTGYHLDGITTCPGAKGATQTLGGNSTAIDPRSGTTSIFNGSFGHGGYTVGGDGGGQGGGGWYGGGAADYAGGGGGGSGHIGDMLTNGSMQSGIREGAGYAILTWQQLP
ncbi:glycine-rich protein, partial [Segatella albensis]|uniref:glycine-rich protein n=1 Tax=Segatella albensis TaxID=77768 RepID=UPI00046A9A48